MSEGRAAEKGERMQTNIVRILPSEDTINGVPDY